MARNGTGVTDHNGRVRLHFDWNGKRMRPCLPMPYNEANVHAAYKVLGRIKKAIREGTFEFASEFPDSKLVRAGDLPKPKGARGLTISVAIANFLKTKADKSANTRKLYRNAGEVWKTIFGADTLLGDLDATKVEITIGEHPFASPKLRNDYLIVLRGAFKLAHKTDKTWPNPAEDLENKKRPDPVPKPVDEVEQAKILKHLRDHYDERAWAYYVWQFETGCRPEETIVVQHGDIDLRRRKVHIQRARSLSVTGPVKTHENRYIDLSDDALAALDVMRKYTYRAHSPENTVFQNPNTGSVWNDARSQHDHFWKPTLKSLGIQARRAYNTRHTYASLRLSMGADVYYISKQMGHKTIGTTMKTYALYIDSAKQEADRVRQLMTGLKADVANRLMQ